MPVIIRFLGVLAFAFALAARPVLAAETPRLDLRASVSQPLSAQDGITWTIEANNGGTGAAYGSLAAWNVFSDFGTGLGVVIFDEVPRFDGVSLELTSPASYILHGVERGVAGKLYYGLSNRPPRSPGDWSAVYVPHAHWIALLLFGGAGNVQLPPAPMGSVGAGRVFSPQVTLAFTTRQPRGCGAADPGAVSNMANAVAGDGAGGLWGPALPAGARDGLVSLAGVERNTMPGDGRSLTRRRLYHGWWIFRRRVHCKEADKS